MILMGDAPRKVQGMSKVKTKEKPSAILLAPDSINHNHSILRMDGSLYSHIGFIFQCQTPCHKSTMKIIHSLLQWTGQQNTALYVFILRVFLPIRGFVVGSLLQRICLA
jgi:hypothetical protein